MRAWFVVAAICHADLAAGISRRLMQIALMAALVYGVKREWHDLSSRQ
jgi:hypothetical protein